MRTKLILLSTSLMIGLAACDSRPSNADATPPPAPQAQATDSSRPTELDMGTAADQANIFAGNFYGRIASEKSGNLFFSPLSIHAALSMTYAGARGETASQMQEVLAFRHGPEEGAEHHAYSQLLEALNNPQTIQVPSPDPGKREMVERPVFDLIVANRLWGQQGFDWNQGYIELTQREYLAGLETVDFEHDSEGARQAINTWVEDTTRDRIQDLIPAGALNNLTRLVLTNAIYFKANWASAFEELATRPEPFRLQSGQSVDVPTMHQTDKFGYLEDADWQALEMPYEGDALSMIVLLPADREGTLSALESQLAEGDVLAELSILGREDVQVWLPKFEMTEELDLGSTLQSMGMTLAFSDRADFSGMAADAKLQISKALHKAFVEVDEKGTEAAAATAVVIGLTSMPMQPEEPKVFRADRPFLFLIRHKASGAVLFVGRVMDPR
jgi:serpin B